MTSKCSAGSSAGGVYLSGASVSDSVHQVPPRGFFSDLFSGLDSLLSSVPSLSLRDGRASSSADSFLKKEFSKLKTRLAKKYGLGRIPSDIDVFLNAPAELRKQLSFLKRKPVRTLSGVAVCSLMTKPYPCPHGKCIMCPGGPGSFFGDVPQSYTGKEPATMRAIRSDFDPYIQIMSRLEQYAVSGHNFDKVEVIIQGGTFPAYPWPYQKSFVKGIFQALNDFGRFFFSGGSPDLGKIHSFFELGMPFRSEKRTELVKRKLRALRLKSRRRRVSTLESEMRLNEHARVRCVGLTIETKPDWAFEKHANRMLELGCTRVELGFQTNDDATLRRINRGHTLQDSVDATRILKDLAFKINYHVMLGLPGSTLDSDRKMLSDIFRDDRFRPDMMKIYPCLVMPGTQLYLLWKAGKFRPISTADAVSIISDFLPDAPEYVRVMRVQRDIPTNVTASGVDRTNLRQYVSSEISKRKKVVREIRSREIGHVSRSPVRGERPVLEVFEYDASNGKEFFLSFVYRSIDALAGYLRLRFPSSVLRPELKNAALVRELHVLGSAVPIGNDPKSTSSQHRGLGKRLLKRAEDIARKNGFSRIAVISGVGVRAYYRKLGYRKAGPYMVKRL